MLQSLFRGGNHKKLADFLMRDFRQDKHKDAACKNAFTLLGQHRYELAAAFFVLGMLQAAIMFDVVCECTCHSARWHICSCSQLICCRW